MNNFLATISVSAPTADGLVAIIKALITSFSSVALGVVVFTLILKLITLPFDYFSRSSMRKNSLKMEQMRPDLEKLKTQYANDKMLYNQKMMALYKKNGYSMFGACLPTILTLVIFIVALSAFSNYSNYQNQQYIYNMSVAYNNVLVSGIDADGEYIIQNYDTGAIRVNCDKVDDYEDGTLGKIEDLIKNETAFEIVIGSLTNAKGETFALTVKGDAVKTLSFTTTNGYIEYCNDYLVSDSGTINYNNTKTINLLSDKLTDNTAYNLASDYNNNLLTETGKNFTQFCEAYRVDFPTATYEVCANAFIEDISASMSANQFRADKESFLWVKNIWIADSAFKHPVNEFSEAKGISRESDYNLLTSKLTTEKTEANGYFILVALTALSSLLMQLIMSKSQKAQLELQSVDGQGAKTQKMMMWLMPIMMAVFAFFYTAAFSIYIILSSTISIITTISINKIVDHKFKKKALAEAKNVPFRREETATEGAPAREVKYKIIKSDDKKKKDNTNGKNKKK